LVKAKRLRLPKNFTPSFKLRVVDAVADIRKGGQTRASEMTGVCQGTISKWCRDKDKLQVQALKDAGSRGRGNVGRVLFRRRRGPRPMYADAETMVMTKVEGVRRRG
jgi:transposase-like protein